MTGVELGASLFAVCLVLIALRMPVAIAMFVTGGLGFASLAGWDAFLNLLNTVPFGRVSSYTLSVIPLFLLMGVFAARAGLGAMLFDAARAWTGHYRGGLATSTVFGSAAFGSICGSSLATSATMASVALPPMKRFGYAGSLANGALAAGGTLGILIPPSLILMIYGVITEQSIGKLFLAAIVPGILATLAYWIAIVLYVRWRPSAGPSLPAMPLADRLRFLISIWPVALIFLTVVGGIYLGVFTPTEGAAVGALATGIAARVLGRLDWETFVACLLETAQTTGMIFLILIGADIFNSFLALSQITTVLADALSATGLAPIAILVGILLVYLVLGCVMDSMAMILLTVPVFLPLLLGLDFGYSQEQLAIWFGILALFAVEIGLITPPIGLNVYVINSLDGETPLAQSFRGIVPFLFSGIAVVAIMLLFPELCLWLPDLK